MPPRPVVSGQGAPATPRSLGFFAGAVAPGLLGETTMLGLVLTAGGARGAYQAGVLKRIGELAAVRDEPLPFQIVTGASAGAINGALIASRSASFRDATRLAAQLWSELRVEQVFRTDAWSLALGALGMARDMGFGGILGHTVTQSLFDASPLYDLVTRHFDPRGIPEAIERGHLYAIAITATSYHSGRSYTFVQGRPGHPVWTKSRRVVLPVEIGPEHVCASAAIPIVFSPVRIPSVAGDLYFGDGGLRLVTPFSPAIRLGATRVLAVGIRSQRASEALARQELGTAEEAGSQGATVLRPPLAQICGVLLNAIFLDHLDSDLDHLRRMNDLIIAYETESGSGDPTAPMVSEPMRLVTPLVVTPSEDLALVAQRFAHRMPRLVRYLMEGLGTPDAQSADLMSYLLFDSTYTRALVDIGYRDAGERAVEIEAFLEAASAEASSPRTRWMKASMSP